MSSKYIDFPNRLTDSAKFVTDAEVVRQNLERLLTTEQGDFIDNPDYGVSLRRFLYEPMTETTGEFIDMEIRNQLETWMGDTITLKQLKIDMQTEDHIFVIELSVYINEFDEQIVMQVPFDETS